MTVDTITGSQLDRRVTLQQPVITRDADFGAEIKTWANVAIVWACISEDTASEAVQADERVLTRLISVRVRYRADMGFAQPHEAAAASSASAAAAAPAAAAAAAVGLPAA